MASFGPNGEGTGMRTQAKRQPPRRRSPMQASGKALALALTAALVLAVLGTTPALASRQGTPSVSIGDATVLEGDSGTVDAAFTVSASEVSDQTITVDYATADDTATAGSDYVAASGTATIDPGDLST